MLALKNITTKTKPPPPHMTTCFENVYVGAGNISGAESFDIWKDDYVVIPIVFLVLNKSFDVWNDQQPISTTGGVVHSWSTGFLQLSPHFIFHFYYVRLLTLFFENVLGIIKKDSLLSSHQKDLINLRFTPSRKFIYCNPAFVNSFIFGLSYFQFVCSFWALLLRNATSTSAFIIPQFWPVNIRNVISPMWRAIILDICHNHHKLVL